MSEPIKIAVAGFHHETNTFAKKKTYYKDFKQADSWPKILKGKEFFTYFKNINIPMSGFIDSALQDGSEIIPLLWCSAPPSGKVTDFAYNKIINEIILMLKNISKLDAIYLDLHGAMVTEHLDDGEGFFLELIKKTLGCNTKIIVSLDLHANISKKMVEHSDLLEIFRTYPHIDMYDTGIRSYNSLIKLLNINFLKDKIYKKFVKPNFLIPIVSQSTISGPAKLLYDKVVDQLNTHSCIISISLAMGFPPADGFWTGPSLVGYGTDEKQLKITIIGLLNLLKDQEKNFYTKIYNSEDALFEAKRLSLINKRLIISDTQDNPGAGGASDTTGLLRALLKNKITKAVLAIICCPMTAKKAHMHGVGKSIKINLGGISDNEPWKGAAKILNLGNGKFIGTGKFYSGTKMNLGLMASLEIENNIVIVSSVKAQAADKSMLHHLEINTKKVKLFILKSSVHFRADFEEIKNVIICSSPGVNPVDHKKLNYLKLNNKIRLMPLSINN